MNWRLSYNLDAEKYVPRQKGRLTNLSLTNTSPHRMVVTQVLLKFDWIGTYRYLRKVNINVAPNETVKLPDVRFSIDLAAPTGSHNYKPGISYKLLEEGKWNPYPDTYVRRGEHVMIESLPAKEYTVFVSHSNHEDDKNLVSACKDAMKTCGITGYFAEEVPRPGYRLWGKITREIIGADAFLVLWTKRASKSGDVREEVGIAIGSGKLDRGRVLPIVQRGVDVAGSLKASGIEWIDYEPPNHTRALSKAFETIMEWAKEKELKKIRQERARAVKREREAIEK